MEEEGRKQDRLASTLTNTIETKNKHVEEMNPETSKSLEGLVEEKDKLLQDYIEEITKIQREHLQKIFNDHEKQLKSNRQDLELRAAELECERKRLADELEQLRKNLDDKDGELESKDDLIQTLVVKERASNLELYDARQELFNNEGLQDFWNSQTKIGIKWMGQVNIEPFKDACKKQFAKENWEVKSMQLCSKWQSLVENSTKGKPSWFPIKKQLVNRELKEIVDCDDKKLKKLRMNHGDEVVKAVSDALLELNEYNGSGRSMVRELWNFEEGKRASLKEAVECIIGELKKRKPVSGKRGRG